VITTKQSSKAYSPEVLGAIHQAYDALWVTLYGREPHKNVDMTKERSIALSQTLVGLVADGVTDPKELRRKGLEIMATTPPWTAVP
jgi:hypothetical protein